MQAHAAFRTIVLSLAAIGVASCGAEVEHDEAVAVVDSSQALLVEEIDAPDFRIVAAIMTNRDVGDARARIGGTLTRLLVREGDTVEKGELVAVIGDDRIDAEARAASAAVTAAAATAERTKSALERAERLFAAQAIARAEIERARTEASAAEAGLRAARAQAAAAQAVKEQGQVAAPADGRVTRAPIPQGSVVLPGEVVVAISTGAQVLRIELPESEGRTLEQGQELRIVEGANGAETAIVRQVYPAVTRGRVTVDLDAPGVSDDLIGSRVRVAAPLGVRRAIVIPERMIVTRFGADYVRLLRAGDAVIEAPVQRGADIPTDETPDGVEILSGLRAGDRILPPETAQ